VLTWREIGTPLEIIRRATTTRVEAEHRGESMTNGEVGERGKGAVIAKEARLERLKKRRGPADIELTE